MFATPLSATLAQTINNLAFEGPQNGKISDAAGNKFQKNRLNEENEKQFIHRVVIEAAKIHYFFL